jgi:hypothetical protein
MTPCLRWTVLLPFLLIAGSVWAQPSEAGELRGPLPDSLATTGRGADTVSAVLLPSKSPATAMVLSAIFPGAGQFYNTSYWKVPVVAGLGVYFLFQVLDNARQYRDYRDQYSAALETSLSGDPRLGLLLRLRDFYRGERDRFAWYFLVLYLVNIADAYVDASLSNFDVSANLSMLLTPGPRLGFELRF